MAAKVVKIVKMNVVQTARKPSKLETQAMSNVVATFFAQRIEAMREALKDGLKLENLHALIRYQFIKGKLAAFSNNQYLQEEAERVDKETEEQLDKIRQQDAKENQPLEQSDPSREHDRLFAYPILVRSTVNLSWLVLLKALPKSFETSFSIDGNKDKEMLLADRWGQMIHDYFVNSQDGVEAKLSPADRQKMIKKALATHDGDSVAEQAKFDDDIMQARAKINAAIPAAATALAMVGVAIRHLQKHTDFHENNMGRTRSQLTRDMTDVLIAARNNPASSLDLFRPIAARSAARKDLKSRKQQQDQNRGGPARNVHIQKQAPKVEVRRQPAQQARQPVLGPNHGNQSPHSRLRQTKEAPTAAKKPTSLVTKPKPKEAPQPPKRLEEKAAQAKAANSSTVTITVFRTMKVPSLQPSGSGS